jgi:MFS family permease
MREKDSRLFYGWWIVIGGFILHFIGIGIGINAIGVFFKPVVESLGFTRGDFSLYFTISALSMMLAAPFIGKLLEKLDVRIVMGVSTALLAAGFALFSQCRTLTHFYLVAVIVGVGHAGSHIIPVSMMINNWFVKRRGMAMGIVFSATGLGGLVFNPVANWLVLNYGWEQTYIILGALIGLFCVPTALLIMRRTPEEMGLLPDGAAAKTREAAGAATGYTLGQSVKLPIFWMLAGMILFLNALNMGIQQHLIPYLTDLGHSPTFAANIMAVYLGMTIAGKLVLGRISDREGVVRGYVVFCVVLGVGIGILFGAQIAWLAVLFGVVYGFANAIQTVVPPLMTADGLGLKHYALIYGVMNIFSTLGAGIGMPLSGYIYDATGSYGYAFVLYIVLTGLAMVLGILAMRRAKFAREKAL